jgi:LysM repeat protein
MNKIFIIAFVLGISTLNAQDFVRYYIDKYKDICIEEMNKTGIPASIKLAQGMLESNWGRSFLATEANNHFGIKCGGNWTGDTIGREDDDYVDNKLVKSCFRSYNYVEQSFYDHSRFLVSGPRYQFLFDFQVTDYRSWAQGLSQAGYATDPQYASKLVGIIERYGLYEYDLYYSPINMDYVHAVLTNLDEMNYSIAYINGCKIVIAKKGDSPVSISKSVGILAEDILRYNDNIRRKYQIFDEGDHVFLENKKEEYTGFETEYIASESETLVSVSQKYGVDLTYLSRLNGIRRSTRLQNGQTIKLRDVVVNDVASSMLASTESDPRFLFDEPLTPKK